MLTLCARAVSPVLQPVKRELDALALRLNSTTDFHSAAVDAASAMFHRFEVVQHAPARPRLDRKARGCPRPVSLDIFDPDVLQHVQAVQHALQQPSGVLESGSR